MQEIFGIKTAKGDYIAFIDDDAIVDCHLAKKNTKGLSNTSQIVGGQSKTLIP